MNDNTQSRVSIQLTGFNPTDAAVVLLSDASIDIDHEHGQDSRCFNHDVARTADRSAS